jgi:drug/metabolite transporter (DMT)-like permease
MSERLSNWILFILLSIIWGSSFILMKKGLLGLSAFQVASVRIVAAGVFLLPIAIRSFKTIPSKKMGIVFLSGTFGSLLPAYLFCVAEQKIESSLAGSLNSLTPIFAIITGYAFFKNKPSFNKLIGILIAALGCWLLYFSRAKSSEGTNLSYVLWIMLATLFYGFNVNMVQRYLKEIPSLHIVSVAMLLNAIPAFFVLMFSGFFQLALTSSVVVNATLFSMILGIVGTSVANILFYVLIKKAGAVFSSMVTYGIPFVAIFWGVIYHEKTGWMQVLSLSVILAGVYIANRKRSNL